MGKKINPDVLAALTCDSSKDGCDPDWRQGVLEKAAPEEVRTVEEMLRDKLPKEV